jgi:hypothetical protein
LAERSGKTSRKIRIGNSLETMMTATPFSRRILPSGPRNVDNQKLRNRVIQYVSGLLLVYQNSVRREVSIQTGDHRPLVEYLTNCDWMELIDSVAYIANGLEPWPELRTEWLKFITTAFEQEHVTFKIEADGSPVSVVDEAFSELVEATLDELNDPLFETARQHCVLALKKFKRPDTLGESIEQVFKAAENIYRMTSKKDGIGAGVSDYYRGRWVSRLAGPEKEAVERMSTSLKEWVNAVHPFRHADSSPKPTPPSRETAVWLITCGMSHIRWMAHVHRDLLKHPNP